jgi:hypothetical protein
MGRDSTVDDPSDACAAAEALVEGHVLNLLGECQGHGCSFLFRR